VKKKLRNKIKEHLISGKATGELAGIVSIEDIDKIADTLSITQYKTRSENLHKLIEMYEKKFNRI